MISSRYLRKPLFVLCFLFLIPCTFAQSQSGSTDYVPQVFQPGKDVVWVPTEYKLAEKMLNLAEVTSQDYVIDLGSGDGRIVIAAAKRGADALGIEYNPDLVALSKRNAVKEGVAAKAKFIQGDLFESDFSQATVLTMFLLPEINLKLCPIILNLKPGVRIVSNSFNMGDWTADRKVDINKEEGCEGFFCEAYLWIVPAKVEGLWKLPQGELTLKQSYQMVSGALKTGANVVSITNGGLTGDIINFNTGDAQYTGKVSGDAMQGTFKYGGKDVKWKAIRIGGKGQGTPAK